MMKRQTIYVPLRLAEGEHTVCTVPAGTIFHSSKPDFVDGRAVVVLDISMPDDGVITIPATDG